MTRSLFSCAFLLAACCALETTASAFSPVIGDEFVVGGGEKDIFNGAPSLATSDGSTFVVAWRQFDASATDEIRFARLDGPELIPGSEVLVSAQPALSSYPRVAVASSGTFLVVWNGDGGADDDAVLARLYDAGGAPLGASFAVNTFTTGMQRFPQVAARSDGSFVVVWNTEADGDGNSIARAVVGAGGGVSSAESVVNTFTTGDQGFPRVAVSPGDGFMVVWDDANDRDGDGAAVFAQRFNAAASPAGTEFQVNSFTTGSQFYPRIETDSAGNFVVAWSTIDGSDPHPMFRKLDASGAFLGAEVTIAPAGPPVSVEIATSGAGEIAFAWDDMVQRYDSSGAAIGTPIALTNGPFPFFADIAYDADGDLIRTWSAGWQVNFSVDRRMTLTAETCIDDAADADGDGIGDRCDSCSGGSEPLGDSRLTLKSVNTNQIFHDDRIQLSGELVLPVSAVFGDIDPRVDPVRIRVESAAGLPVLDAVLTTATFGGAGTAGWTVNNPGTQWKFRDKTASPVENIVSMAIKDENRKAPGQVSIKLQGRYGLYFVDDDDLPLRASVLLGDAAAGLCTETEFVLSDCSFKALGTTGSCKH